MPRNVAKFTEWITGICGALSVNGRKLALALVRLPKSKERKKKHYNNNTHDIYKKTERL